MKNPTIVRVTTLSVLTSLVDGQATSDELDIMSREISSVFGVAEGEVRGFAQKLIDVYQKKNIAANPVALVKQGQSALGSLSGRNRAKTMEIARKVASSGGLEVSESTFLDNLADYVSRYRR
ncbi:MAG: hypothetical protein R3A44_03870 [Caldilineaceae bacterium]